MIYNGTATALDAQDPDNMIPIHWDDWVNLPYDPSYHYVGTSNLQIRVPKVIVLCRFDRVPSKRPKFTTRNLIIRDRGIDQYTGLKLNAEDITIDHVVPRDQGGISSWTNCVITHRDVNFKKANRTPQQAGLKLIRQPVAPKNLPLTLYIRNAHKIKEWDVFLKDFTHE
jgi:5-methylcytosine-specific restriction endonuclease McrA